MFLAVAGKGGTGKTTFIALTIKHLLAAGRRPILAVDADPNANLAQALGMEAPTSIAGIMQAVAEDREQIPLGMTKDQYVAYRLHQSLEEGQDIDLLVMGGPEGPGCYCYVNNLLRAQLQKLVSSYAHVLMDNEAGLEHLSRRTTQNVDYFFVISDATVKGIRSAARIKELAQSLKLRLGQEFLVVNRARPGDKEALLPEITKTQLPLAGTIPVDPLVAEYDLHCRPLLALPDEAPAVQAVRELLQRVGIL
ncbi:nucleotide-binding protein [Desulfothermobacter acidiphilus]|uniref:ATP-binding protein n=1 Tax=Desulfothermobacter acidiphilus TaxID=1938353 RepID=UPI003F893BCC